MFSTELGWFGLLGCDGVLHAATFGHRQQKGVASELLQKVPGSSRAFQEQDWHPELRERLTRFAEGECVEFDDIEICHGRPLTPFQTKIVQLTRRLGWGQTSSYGELAARAGRPGAARAVGTVMSSNLFPIVVPCHRVLAARGKIGGYGAGDGVPLKQRLLDQETGM
ncbi:MAG TPA: methylated-DNA--[protein]-cysteine S-methyltransferase [Planctomycetaceae bacterium]|nr:methylated-DNA--[protein]-cysteine S-methyltransferase [Planctomycetaceae bacterium]